MTDEQKEVQRGAQEQQDAARYRWLRSSKASNDWNRLGHYGADELDAQIDAMLNGEGALTQSRRET